jgi:hypothetical protein
MIAEQTRHFAGRLRHEKSRTESRTHDAQLGQVGRGKAECDLIVSIVRQHSRGGDGCVIRTAQVS